MGTKELCNVEKPLRNNEPCYCCRYHQAAEAVQRNRLQSSSCSFLMTSWTAGGFSSRTHESTRTQEYTTLQHIRHRTKTSEYSGAWQIASRFRQSPFTLPTPNITTAANLRKTLSLSRPLGNRHVATRQLETAVVFLVRVHEELAKRRPLTMSTIWQI